MENLDGFYGKRVCVAVSGGVDSIALLHYLKSREKSGGFSLSAVHCEHGIRGEESVRDWKFVEKMCAAWGIPLFIFRENCPAKAAREKTSLETAAREFRYACFAELLDGGKVDLIATAHHISDEAETVLFHIARGAALSGAVGMKAMRAGIVRPFLSWSKEKIAAYAKEHVLAFVEDSTNFELDATRNKLRLEVLPALENAVAGARENIARFARLAREDDEYLYAESKKLRLEKDGVQTVLFCDKKPLFTRACLTAMKALGVEKDYTSAHLESLFLLQESERGARLDLKKGVTAEKTREGIKFFLKEDEEEICVALPNEKPFDKTGFDGGRYAVNVLLSPPKRKDTNWKTLRVDGEKLPKDATFRFRREGDEIEKFGGGKKSLKKFFNEKKIPVKERAYLPLIASASGNAVYVVCGVEIADGVKVTEETQSVLYITTEKI